MNMPPKRLSDYIATNAHRFPQREALVFGETRLSWAETANLVDRCARAMLAAGVRRGDRVAMLSPPRPEYVIVLFAAMKVGALWLGLNPRHKTRELEYVLKDAAPKLLFCQPEFEGRDFVLEIAGIRDRIPGSILVAVGAEAGKADVGLFDFLSGDVLVPPAALEAAAGKVSPTDPAVIIYTSGTTGEPKGAILSGDNLAYSYSIQASRWWVENLRIINNMPINHIGGLGDITAYATISAGTMIFMERFEPEGILDLVARERVTVLGQVTAMYQKIVASRSWKEADLSSLQLLWWAGSEAPLKLVSELAGRVRRTATYYGMSELAGSVAYVEFDASENVKATTIGKPVAGFSVRIADEEGNTVPDGETGEIQVSGRNVFLGYWQRVDETQASFTSDGWFRTGDLARTRSDGNWEIAGRLKEMYKSGGYNIYPREIEQVLEGHPDIDSACIIAIPDPEWQEVGCAFVRPRQGRCLDERILRSYAQQALANYKVPKRIIVVSEWPMTHSGKIDKSALKDTIAR